MRMPFLGTMFPFGNFINDQPWNLLRYYRTVTPRLLRLTPKQIGKLIRETRKRLGVTQRNLALTAGTGIRFVIDLEKGKETCRIGKVLTILNTLGIKVILTPPPAPAKKK
jgi:y4mF family transcriptional regulator